MSTSIEAQGVTVDEAIQVALNQLGVTRDSVEIKIIHHPRSGFLGIGARKAKVRATVRKSALQDGEEFDMSEGGGQRRGRRGRRGSRRGRGGRSQGGERPDNKGGGQQSDRSSDRGQPQGGRGRQQQARGSNADKAERDEKKPGRGQNQRSKRSDPEAKDQPRGQQAAQQTEGEEKRSEQTSERRSRRGRRGGRGRDRRRREAEEKSAEPQQADGLNAAPQNQDPDPVQPESQAADPVKADSANAPADNDQKSSQSGRRARKNESRSDDAPRMSREQVIERAVPMVEELVKRMGFEAEVKGDAADDSGDVTVSITSDAEGLLIGRRGQTLDALEHVVNRMIFTGEPTSDARVQIDVGGYRARRRESLLELAGRLKDRAVSQGRRVQVSPMSQRDRRILQAALADDDAVETRALGSGFYRRVLIAPSGLADDGSPVEEISEDSIDPGDAS